MLAIYKREVRAYFQSFIGLLFIAVTLFFVSLYFVVYNLFSGYPYLAYPFSSVLFLFLFTVPVLSMRILAEEKRNKTDQLILTAPVSVSGIVMGKFLALLTIFAIPVALFCVYPLILTMYGTPAMAESYLAILGFFLYGMAAIAIGIWISSLTESQVIAAVISFFALFLGFMMDGLCGLISENGNWLTKILRLFDMSTPYQEFMNGVLNLKSVLYFICLTVLMLFLTVQSIQKRRYQVSVKTLSLGAYSTGGIALVIALIVAVNLVVGEMPSTWTKVDVTSNKLYTLTDKTKEYLKTMQRDVTIYVLAGKQDRDELLGQTLDKYEELSKHIRVEYVDPGVNPKFYQKYTSSATLNSLIVTDENRTKVVDYNDVYEYDTSYDYYGGGYNSEVIGYDGEGEITSAIAYVLSENVPKIYMTSGHGEESLTSTYLDALKKENMEYDTLRIMDEETIPEDAAAVLVNAPIKDFSADDVETLKKYLDQGGKVILILSYEAAETPNLDGLMEYMGLSKEEGFVVEQSKSNYYRNPYYLLPTIAYSDYTSGIYGQYYVFAPISKGILWDEGREDVEYDVFMKTSDSAFSKAGDSGSIEFNALEGDTQGPFGVGVEAIKTSEDGTIATMVVYGSSKLFTDEANSMVAGANLMLFSNTMGSDESGASVSVPVKAYDLSYLTVSEAHVVFFGVLTVLVLPLICLITGFVIWLRRRKR